MISLSNTRFFKLFVACVLLVFFSCGGDDPASSIEDFLVQFNVNAQQTSSGLYYTLIDQGNGAPITESKFLMLNVTQFDLANNVTSRSDDDFPVALNIQELVPGLVEGLQLLNEGGRANFYIPPSLSGGSIVAGALIFGIEVVSIYDSLEEYNDTLIQKYLDDNSLTGMKTDDGLYVVIEDAGDGTMPTSDSRVTVDYHGTFLNGQVFDSSVDRGTPSTFRLTEVIEGWQLGIPLLSVSGKGRLIIPSNLAYGASGNASIPGNYPLAFEVELISID